MNSRKKVNQNLLWLVSISIILIIIPIFAKNVPMKDNISTDFNFNIKMSVPHAPISINNNSELDAFCVGTTGLSWGDAHIIENLEIDGGATQPAISIRNTDRYLVIRNITASNPGVYNIFYGTTFYFNNSKNIRIRECNLDNNIINGFHGISLWRTNNCLILDNRIQRNAWNDIVLTDCHNNTLLGNDCQDSNSHSISLWDCTNCTVSENECRNHGTEGLAIVYSSDIRVLRNNFTNSDMDGTKIYSSANNLIKDNLFSNNAFNGIYLDNGDGNIITGNIISNNSEYGIRLSANSENNEVYQNYLGNNTLGCILDLGTNNVHDNGDCIPITPAGDISGYPLILILTFILFGSAVFLLKKLKKNQI
jgi:parallel beta-helix repeat protein